MSKAIRLSNGGKIVNGQMHAPQVGRDPRRAKNSQIADPGIHPAMSRQTAGTPHPYHGVSINDEVAEKLHLDGAAVPTHPGMTKTASGPSGSEVLKAGQLGSNTDPDFDHSHVGHKVRKSAALPPKAK